MINGIKESYRRRQEEELMAKLKGVESLEIGYNTIQNDSTSYQRFLYLFQLG